MNRPQEDVLSLSDARLFPHLMGLVQGMSSRLTIRAIGCTAFVRYRGHEDFKYYPARELNPQLNCDVPAVAIFIPINGVQDGSEWMGLAESDKLTSLEERIFAKMSSLRAMGASRYTGVPNDCVVVYMPLEIIQRQPNGVLDLEAFGIEIAPNLEMLKMSRSRDLSKDLDHISSQGIRVHTDESGEVSVSVTDGLQGVFYCVFDNSSFPNPWFYSTGEAVPCKVSPVKGTNIRNCLIRLHVYTDADTERIVREAIVVHLDDLEQMNDEQRIEKYREVGLYPSITSLKTNSADFKEKREQDMHDAKVRGANYATDSKMKADDQKQAERAGDLFANVLKIFLALFSKLKLRIA